MSKTTFNDLLMEKLSKINEDLIYCTLNSELLHKEFDPGFGGNGDDFYFLAYTKNYVIYNHEYDGSTNLELLRRNPPMEEIS